MGFAKTMNELETKRKELLELIFKRLIPMYDPFKTTFDNYQLDYDIKVRSERIRIQYDDNNRDKK